MTPQAIEEIICQMRYAAGVLRGTANRLGGDEVLENARLELTKAIAKCESALLPPKDPPSEASIRIMADFDKAMETVKASCTSAPDTSTGDEYSDRGHWGIK